MTVERPALEGTVAVRDGRRLSFAEYGSPRGPAIVWMHGTPGARRQIPLEARAYAEEHGLRIIGVDRPGIGSSTPHLYGRLVDWTADLELLLDALAVDTCRLIGLSGGGPYVLAAGARLPERVHGVGVLGETGRGTVEHFGLLGEVDVITGTLGKALGSQRTEKSCALRTSMFLHFLHKRRLESGFLRMRMQDVRRCESK